jgi:hypothetical protein
MYNNAAIPTVLFTKIYAKLHLYRQNVMVRFLGGSIHFTVRVNQYPNNW